MCNREWNLYLCSYTCTNFKNDISINKLALKIEIALKMLQMNVSLKIHCCETLNLISIQRCRIVNIQIAWNDGINIANNLKFLLINFQGDNCFLMNFIVL